MGNKILVVEDNIITAKHISNSLINFGYVVTGQVNSIEGVKKNIINSTPDLVILDINLGREIDGIQIAEMLEKEFGIAFIFLTSYNDEKTINRILKLRPLGYIIKPFNPKDLKYVIEIALFKINSNLANHTKKPIEIGASNLDEFLFVKNGKNIDRIPICNIEFIHADGRYTYIHCEKEKKISNTPLKLLREKLSKSHFVQIHKSYIVNLTKVDTITYSYLLIRDIEIPISKNFKGDLIGGLDIV